MEITVEIDAPKIIIPEDSSDPAKGGVLLDTGVLCITGMYSICICTIYIS